MLALRTATSRDLEAVREICFTSFELTAMDRDKVLNIDGGVYLWNVYAKRAFERHLSHCVVAERNGRVIGFLIFGVDADMGRRVGYKVGNIILLGVEKESRSKGVGKALVKYVLDEFQKHDFKLVHVGTDSDNISALNVYQSLGFRNVLSWGTYRNYSRDTFSESVVELRDVRVEKSLEKYDFVRTHSFFYDNKIDRSSVRAKHKDALILREETSSIKMYEVVYNREAIGFVTLTSDEHIASHINAPFMRIEDIVIIEKYRESELINKSVIAAAVRLCGRSAVEMWAASNRFQLINALTENGFCYVHSACVLHLWLSR